MALHLSRVVKSSAALAGKSTLNRLELSQAEPTRYHKISHDGPAIEQLFVQLFLEAHRKPPARSFSISMPPMTRCMVPERPVLPGCYDCFCYLPLYVFCRPDLLGAKLRRSNIDASAGAVWNRAVSRRADMQSCRSACPTDA
ncbi:MAG: hypothetical protein JO110_19780 [Acetobacteraceae bacterium]|nr:hypothetical protein [Acetobacteraceae bacterium]